MSKIIWRILPDNITLSDPNNWQKTLQDRYRATRYYVSIVEEKVFEAKSTPPLITVPVPTGVKPAFSEKRVVVVTYTESITDTVEHSVASKFAAESSLKSSVSVKEGFSSELQTKISTEISTALSSQLSSTKTYQVQSTHEIVTSVAFERPVNAGQEGKLTYYLYLPVWPMRWNIYLYRIESLELSYHRFSFKRGVSKFFKKVRESLPLDIYEARLPLAQLSFYEPQDVIAVHSGEYTPEVIYPDQVHTGLLATPCGELTVPEPTMSLEECARIAFPETEEEVELREKAKKVNKERKKSPLTRELERAEMEQTNASRRGGGTVKKKATGSTKTAAKRKASAKGSLTGRAKSADKSRGGRKQSPLGGKGMGTKSSRGSKGGGRSASKSRGASRRR